MRLIAGSRGEGAEGEVVAVGRDIAGVADGDVAYDGDTVFMDRPCKRSIAAIEVEADASAGRGVAVGEGVAQGKLSVRLFIRWSGVLRVGDGLRCREDRHAQQQEECGSDADSHGVSSTAR